MFSQRLSSTTTRIKTKRKQGITLLSLCVRDYLPLQQGLRRDKLLHKVLQFRGQRLSSTTTRIKTLQGRWSSFCPKQCQRLSSTTTRIKTINSNLGITRSVSVRDYLPLQQGLRLWSGLSLYHIEIRQRLSSTTTRIKTRHYSSKIEKYHQSETIFHYNKD